MDTNQKIKAVAFDFGGVININAGGHVLRFLADELHIPFEDLRQVYLQHNHLANVDNVRWEEVVIGVVKTFDASAEVEAKARRVLQEFESKNVINKELLELFPRLRKAGLKVGILSNAGTHLRKRLEEEGIAPLVDEIVISGEIGHQKPHKEAFQILFDRLGVSAHEVVFIDDSEKSLEKAAEIGYTPVLFTGNQKLIVDLENLGLDF
jgi:putative hydrolase of the HAD superfamily